jgi:quinol monooxygenase YgiN
MVVVLGRVEIEPEDVEAFVIAVREVEAATRQEAGCLSYAFGQDVASPHLFWLSESWMDHASLAAHREAPHILEFRAAQESIRFRMFVAKRYDASGETVLVSR